eukprot:5922947-Amphidinium_carterae.1
MLTRHLPRTGVICKISGGISAKQPSVQCGAQGTSLEIPKTNPKTRNRAFETSDGQSWETPILRPDTVET